jgi:large subunit ribosomal protein L5
MATMTETAPPARLKMRYLEEIRPQLIDRFGYSSVMQAPRLEKITLNMGVGEAKQDSKALKAAVDQMATIAGQQPSVRRARKSIAAFKLREGMPVGVAVTLRGERGYEFLDRLVSIAIPRIRDFRGLNPRSFDGRGNYSMGVKEQIIFPEVDYDAIDQVRGLDITITTTAATDAEAFALLYAFGMPFATQGRPKGFNEAAGVVESDGASGGEAEESQPAVEEQAAAPEPEPEPEAPSEEPQAAAEPEAEALSEAAEPEVVSEEPEASAEQVQSDAEEPPEPEQANAEKESSD